MTLTLNILNVHHTITTKKKIIIIIMGMPEQYYMPRYYQKYFPVDSFVKFLNYGTENVFSRRDFSYFLEDGKARRYRFNDNGIAWKSQLCHILPSRVDLGAVFASDLYPDDDAMKKRYALQRELTFDLDADAYDDVRTCCKEGTICTKCWKYLALACDILEALLPLVYGYKHILWTYSGRRGIHAWVCDRHARHLNDRKRDALLAGIAIMERDDDLTPESTIKVVRIKKMTQIHKKAIDIIKPHFVEICIEDQGLLSDEHLDKFMEYLPEGFIRSEMKSRFAASSTGSERWASFLSFIENDYPKLTGEQSYLVEELMLRFCYPRFDSAVTIQSKHLLKAPFSQHPKTGRIAIPFDAKHVWEFDLAGVPTVEGLIFPYSDESKRAGDKRFKEAMAIFESFIEGLADDKPSRKRSKKMIEEERPKKKRRIEESSKKKRRVEEKLKRKMSATQGEPRENVPTQNDGLTEKFDEESLAKDIEAINWDEIENTVTGEVLAAQNFPGERPTSENLWDQFEEFTIDDL